MNRWLSRVALMAALGGAVAARPALATTVLRTSIADLVDESHVIMRAHVSWVDERAGEATGTFRTRIGFEVAEGLRGTDSETVETTIPGGKVGAYTMQIPGMPRFQPGQEVVILLVHTPGGDAFAGLAQGVFTVDRSSGIAQVRRMSGSDMHLIDHNGTDALPENLDGPLDGLMSKLRTLSVGGVR